MGSNNLGFDLANYSNTLPSQTQRQQLIYYPDLSVSDIQNSHLQHDQKQVLLAALNNQKLAVAVGVLNDRDYADALGFTWVPTIELPKNIQPHILQAVVMLKEVAKTVTTIIWESGVQFDGNPDQVQAEQEAIIRGVVRDVYNDYRQKLSLEEIKIAFHNGVRKRYGDWFGKNGIAVSTFSYWMDQYIKQTQLPALACLKQIKPAQLNQAVLSIAEKKQIQHNWLTGIIDHYKVFCEKDEFTFLDPGAIFYWFCMFHDFFGFELTDNEINEIKQLANHEYATEFDVAKAQTKEQRIVLQKRIDDLAAGQFEAVNSLVVKIRRLKIKYLFQKFKASDVNFETELLQKPLFELKTVNINLKTKHQIQADGQLMFDEGWQVLKQKYFFAGSVPSPKGEGQGGGVVPDLSEVYKGYIIYARNANA